MGKPFFYKVDAAEFMSAVFQIPNGTHEEWLRQLAIDLVAGVGTSEFSKKLIQDVEDYRRKQAEAGSRGGKARSSKPKASLKRPLATLEQASSDPQANSSSSNKDLIPYIEILEILNRETCSKYQLCESLKKLIKARWNEGFRVEDFEHVIKVKSAQWKDDPEWSKYLRPETLFSNKFNSYRQQKIEEKKVAWQNTYLAGY